MSQPCHQQPASYWSDRHCLRKQGWDERERFLSWVATAMFTYLLFLLLSPKKIELAPDGHCTQAKTHINGHFYCENVHWLSLERKKSSPCHGVCLKRQDLPPVFDVQLTGIHLWINDTDLRVKALPLRRLKGTRRFEPQSTQRAQRKSSSSCSLP